MAGTGFAAMSTKWKVVAVIGIIAIVAWCLQIVGLLLTLIAGVAIMK
jgi:hypothetical protein